VGKLSSCWKIFKNTTFGDEDCQFPIYSIFANKVQILTFRALTMSCLRRKFEARSSLSSDNYCNFVLPPSLLPLLFNARRRRLLSVEPERITCYSSGNAGTSRQSIKCGAVSRRSWTALV